MKSHHLLQYSQVQNSLFDWFVHLGSQYKYPYLYWLLTYIEGFQKNSRFMYIPKFV